MANNYFKFKQFTIYQNDAAMKVGTDGVILGSWFDCGNESARILDVGTGTGIIALMAAQRNPYSRIDAIEIDKNATLQAEENIKMSPWANRIAVYNQPLQEFMYDKQHIYDHIVSNPPYFLNSTQSPDGLRTCARHTDTLPYDDLIKGVKRLLKPSGIFSAILPYKEANVFIAMAAVEGLYCNRRLNVIPKSGAAIKRIAMEFSYTKTPVEEQEIFIELSQRGEYSDKYKELTSDFYLKF